MTLTFELSDGSTQSEDMEFTGVNYNDAGSRSKTEIFEVGCYEVTVKVELSITGNNNSQMVIAGAAAEITDSVIICDE